MKIGIFRAFWLLALVVPSLAFAEDGIFNCDLTTFRQLAERRAKLKAAPELRNMPTSAKELDKANAKLNELAKPAMESESGALPELQRLQGKIHEADAQKAAEVAEAMPAKGDRAAAAVRKAFPDGKVHERPAYTDGVYHGDKKPANIGLFAGNFAIPNGIDLDVVQRALKDGHLDEVYVFVDRKAPSFAERQKLAELAFGGNPKVKLIDPSEYRTQSFSSALEDISEKNAGHTITSIGYADTLEQRYFRPSANVKFLIAGPLEDTEMLGGAVRARFGARMEKDPSLVRYLETDKVDLKSLRSAVAAGEKPDSIPSPVLERIAEKKASTAAERAAQDAKPKREKVAREPASVAEEPAVVAKSSVPQYDWTRSEPVTIRGKDGKELPVTLAFDSELPHAEILKHLQGNEAAIKELSDAIAELKAPGNFMFGKKIYAEGFTAKELAETLQISEKQLRGFGNLRKGVDKNKERFLLTDLSPKNFNTMMNGILSPIGRKANGFPQKLLADEDSAKKFMEKYRDIATRVFKDKPDVFDAGIDQNVVEVRHASFESSPSKFHEIVAKDLNENFPGSNTHLHAGFPSAAISQPEMQGVGRSIESRIILQMAAAAPEAVHPLYSTSYSSLREGEWGAKRGGGVIRMNYNKFETPVRSHDLEIRDYRDLHDGFFTLGLAANLGSNHDLLRTVPNFKNVKIDDPFTSNLNGALKYVGTLMKENEDPALQKIGHQLYAFGDKIEEAGKITPEMRKDVFEYLDKNRVTDLLDERVYLKPRTGMAGAFSQWSAEEVKAIKNPITSSNDRAAAVQAIRSLQDSAVTRISDLMVDVRSSGTMPYWEKEALMKSLTKNVFDQANYLDRAESAARQKFEEAKRQHVDPFEYLKLSKDLEAATRAKTRFNAAAYEPMFSARAALASLDPVGEVNKRAEYLAHDIERTFLDSRGVPLQVANDPAMKKALVAGVSAAEAIRYPAFAKKEDLVAKLVADPSYFSKRGLSPKALAELQLPKDVHSMTDAEFQKISGVFWREKAAAFENAYKAAAPESHHSLARSFAQLCLAGANCGEVERGAALAKLAALTDDAGKPGKGILNADGSRSFTVGGKEIRLPPTASSSLAAAIESNKKIILTIGDVEGTHTFLDAYVRDGMMKMGTIKSGPLSFEGYVFTDAAKVLAQNGKLEVQLMGDLINGPYTMRFIKNIQHWNEELLHADPLKRGPKVVAVLGNHDTAKIRYSSYAYDPVARKARLAKLNGAPDTAVSRVKGFYSELGIPWAFSNLRDEFKPFLAERVGKMKVTDKRLNELSEVVAANWFEGATMKPGGDLLEHIMSEHSSLLHLSEGGGGDARGAVIYSHSGVTPENFGKTGIATAEPDKLTTWSAALQETQRLLGEQVVEQHLAALFTPFKGFSDRATVHITPEEYAKLEPRFRRELERALPKDPVMQEFFANIKAGKPGEIHYNPSYDSILNLLTDSKYGTLVAQKEQLPNLPKGMRETLEKRYPAIKAFFAKLEKDGSGTYGVNSPSRGSLTYGNRFMDNGPPGADAAGHVMTKLARATPPADFMEKMNAQGAKLFAVGHTPVPVPVLVRSPSGPALFYSDTTFMPWKKPVNYIHEDGSLHSTSYAAVEGRGIRIETEYVPGGMADSPVGKIKDEAEGPYNIVGKAYDENTGEYLGYALTNQNIADFKPNVILRQEKDLADARFATSIPSREEAAANRDVALMQHALEGGPVIGVKEEFNGTANGLSSIKEYKAEEEAKAFLASEIAKGKKVTWLAGGADFAAVNAGDPDAILNYWRAKYRSPEYHANGTHPGHVRIYGGTNRGFELAERTVYQEALAGKLGPAAKAVAERSSYVGHASFDAPLVDYLHPSGWDVSRDHLLIPPEEVARANHQNWDTNFAALDTLFTFAAEKAREAKAPMPEFVMGGGGGVAKRGATKLLEELAAQGPHPSFRVSLLENAGASGDLLKNLKPELRNSVSGYSLTAEAAPKAAPAWMDITRTQKSDELTKAVAEMRPEEHLFIKDAPLLGYRIKSSDINDVPEAIRVHMGEVDKTNYTKEYLEKKIGSLIALQFDKGKTDFYVIGKDALDAKYEASTVADVAKKNQKYYEGLAGALPGIVGKDDPNLVAIRNIVPSKMVKMSDLGYPIDKEITIESPWQLQTKPAGRDAYLSLDVKKQKYYMVNADDSGLPLSYVAQDPAKAPAVDGKILIPSAHGERVYAGLIPEAEMKRIEAATSESQAKIDALLQEKKDALAAKKTLPLELDSQVRALQAKVAADRQPIIRAAVNEMQADLAAHPVQFTAQQVSEVRGLAQGKGAFDPEKLMDALANTGDPRLKLWYGPTADSGTELGSVRAHMAIVEQQYEKFKAGFGLETVKLPGKGAPSTDEFMRVFLAQHDLAKSEAVSLGDKAAQHEFIAPVMDSILRTLGYPPETRQLAKALITDDTFGPLLRGTYFAKTTDEKAKVFAKAESGLRNEFDTLSQALGASGKDLSRSDYVKLLSAFYQSDSSSYPFLMDNVFNGSDVAKGGFLKVRDPVYGQLLEKAGVPYDNLVKAGEAGSGKHRLSVAFDVDGNFASKISETDPVPPGYKAYHADGSRYLVPDTFVQKVESLIDPAKNKGVPVDVYVFSAGTPQRNLELSSQIQVRKPDGTMSTLRDVSARGGDGQPIVLTRKDLEYVKERVGLEKPGFQADMTQLLADSRVSRFDPFQSAAMVKDLTHITPDLSRVVLVDDNVLFSGINDQAGNLIRSVAMRGEPGLNAKDWSGRLSALIDRAVANVAEGRDARDGLMVRQFRVIRQEDGAFGFRYDVARSTAEKNRNVLGRVTRGPLDPAFRSETNPGGAIRALAEANKVWRPAAGDQANLDKLNGILRANAQPEMTMRELRSNLYESFLQDRLAATGDSVEARTKQLLDDIAKAGPSLKLGAAPPNERRAIKAALVAAQRAAGGTRVFEVSREQSAAGRRAFVDTYLANTGGGQAMRARAAALADLCHAGGMCASVLDVEGSELRAFYHEPAVLAGTDSFSRTVGIHANDVVNGHTVYSSKAMDNLRLTKPALARAVDVNDAYGEALAEKRVGFLKGNVSAADYAAAQRRYGVASIPTLSADRAGALAQQEDFLARRATRARLDNDPTLAQRLDAERASVGAAMLGEQAKAAKRSATDSKQSRRSAVQAIENGDFYRAYADRMGVSFAEAVNDPVQAKRLTAMVENDAAKADAANRAARAHLETQVKAKLVASGDDEAARALAQDIVDLHADGAQPLELARRHPERWNDSLVRNCVEAKLCEPVLEAPVAAPNATSLTARRILAEKSIGYADPKDAAEAARLMDAPARSAKETVNDLHDAYIELGRDVERLQKVPDAKAALDESLGAMRLVKERMGAAALHAREYEDVRAASAAEMQLADQARGSAKRFVEQASADDLQKLGLKDLPKADGTAARYDAFKAEVAAMKEKDAAKVVEAVRNFSAKGDDALARELKKTKPAEPATLAVALIRTDDSVKAVNGDEKVAAATLRFEKVSAPDQALAGAVGAVKAPLTKAEKKAAAVEETKKLVAETKQLAPKDRAPASLTDGVAKLAGLKAEDREALRTAVDTVFHARGTDQAKEDLAHMQALSGNPDLLETYRMAYVSAARELPKAKGGWDEAWLVGVKQMLRDSGYDNLDKAELEKLTKKTAVCLR